MRDYVAGKSWKQEKYDRILEAGFKLFSERGIERVKLEEVADAGGVSLATLFRYFPKKTEFVIEIAIWKWKEYIELQNNLLSYEEREKLTGAEYLKFFVDSFL